MYPADINSLKDVLVYLQSLSRDQLRKLGLVLGLAHITLENFEHETTDSYMYKLIVAWLRQQDNVMSTLPPTWENLVEALRNEPLRQEGIATKILNEKILQ